ncbi:MAG: hypothetical protein ACTHQ3_08625 [Motilibacteraceae bacterium]
MDRHDIAQQVAERVARQLGINWTTGWALKVVNRVLDEEPLPRDMRSPVGFIVDRVRKNRRAYEPTPVPPQYEPWGRP